MIRREFLKFGGAASFGFLAGTRPSDASGERSHTFYVATDGLDEQQGTLENPFASLHRAQQAVRSFRRGNPSVAVTVKVRQGTYYLGRILEFTPEDSGTKDAPVTYTAFPGEKVTLSGGRKLKCQWLTRKSKSICDLNVNNSGPFAFSQLFINGRRQVRARFPDFDSTDPIRGGYVTAVRALPAGTSSPDPADENNAKEGVIGIEFDPETFSQKRWGTPEDAVIHISQQEDLGMLAWNIRSIDYDRNRIWFGKGGGQLGSQWNGSSSAIGKGSRFYVDNVLEEMSKPCEWYLSTSSGTLYYRAEEGMDLESALIEVPALEQIIRVRGSIDKPVEYLIFDGFRLAHTEITYMKSHETLPSGNWSFYRGGAVLFEQTRNCSIRNCWFDAVGGNAVFWNNQNVAGSVTGCKFTESGDNAICFVGTPGNIRQSPSECNAVNNLIRNCGTFGKQIAGIYISCARRISAAHNHIRNVPCAGICIGDGDWGGHIIEHNYIHDTVEETKHYGSLNAYGHEGLGQTVVPSAGAESGANPPLAIAESITLRGNLIREKAGCGIRLASGSTQYEIYKNVAIGTAIRICAGAHRNVYNNIWFNSPQAAELLMGRGTSRDRFHHNVAVVTGASTYRFSTGSDHGQSVEEIDYNCIYQQGGSFAASITHLQDEKEFESPAVVNLAGWQDLGFDRHSSFANPLIADPAHLDFRLLQDSPALKLGFVNFAMNQWGLTNEFPSRWQET